MDKFQELFDSSLVIGLREFYRKSWPSFSDVSIKCSDGKSIEAHKLLLSIRSDYFAALFRQEPDLQIINVPNFDSEVMRIVIKSMVQIDVKDFEQVGFVELLRAADYFQMKELMKVTSEIIVEDISNENLADLFDLTQSLYSPVLEDGCIDFIKKDFMTCYLSGIFRSLPQNLIEKLFSKPWPVFHDKYGRQFGILQTTEILLSQLFETLKVLFLQILKQFIICLLIE